MIKNGYVIMADEHTVKIRVSRDSSCGGNCAHCKGCGNDEVIIETANDQNLKEGEIVKVIMDNKKFLKRAVLGYGGLVAVMILGGILGYEIFGSEIASGVLVVILLAITLLIFRKGFKGSVPDIRIERI